MMLMMLMMMTSNVQKLAASHRGRPVPPQNSVSRLCIPPYYVPPIDYSPFFLCSFFVMIFCYAFMIQRPLGRVLRHHPKLMPWLDNDTTNLWVGVFRFVISPNDGLLMVTPQTLWVGVFLLRKCHLWSPQMMVGDHDTTTLWVGETHFESQPFDLRINHWLPFDQGTL